MIEQKKRSLAKAITWRITGTVDTFVLSWLISGQLKLASAIAGTEVITKMFLYYLHERVWTGVKWGVYKRKNTKVDQEQLDRVGVRKNLDLETTRHEAQYRINVFYNETYRNLCLNDHLPEQLASENAKVRTIEKFGLKFCFPYQKQGSTESPFQMEDISDKLVEDEIKRHLGQFSSETDATEMIECRRKVKNRMLVDEQNNFVTLPNTDSEGLSRPPKSP